MVASADRGRACLATIEISWLRRYRGASAISDCSGSDAMTASARSRIAASVFLDLLKSFAMPPWGASSSTELVASAERRRLCGSIYGTKQYVRAQTVEPMESRAMSQRLPLSSASSVSRG
jgi:hypothetical protein